MSPIEDRPAATLPPVTLTPEEAAAVVAALAAHPDGLYSGHGSAALRKVAEVLEPDPERRSQIIASSMFVSAESTVMAEVRSNVERGVLQRRVMVLRYRDGRGKPSRREVEPQLLVRSRDHWFLVAWCREREAPRWFRLDRIVGAEVTEQGAPRRDPGLFGAPSDTHPAGRALDRHPAGKGRPGLVVLPGGRE